MYSQPINLASNKVLGLQFFFRSFVRIYPPSPWSEWPPELFFSKRIIYNIKKLILMVGYVTEYDRSNHTRVQIKLT
mgnify:CR=1 FL=1